MAAVHRVSDALFRRNMLGPTFGHFAASVTALVLLEKVATEWLLPPWLPMLEALEAMMGRLAFSYASGMLIFTLGFWGVGSLFALPALLRVEKWKIQVNRSLDRGALLQAMPLIVLNFFLGVLIGPLALHALLPERAYDWQHLPGSWTLARDAVVWLLVEEVMFFYVHRSLHENKKIYAAIHKLHHTWTAPVSFVAIYCHPLEHVISNIAPLIAGPILCGSHIATIGVYLFLGLVHTTGVHSGYWICDDNGMHDEHHNKFTVNYGIVGIMDAWYGTYKLPAGAVGTDQTSSAVPETKKVE